MNWHDPNWVGAIGQWVGAIATFLTAVVAVAIAIYSVRQNRRLVLVCGAKRAWEAAPEQDRLSSWLTECFQ